MNKRRVLRYTLMPEILPRFYTLVGTGFSRLAATMAIVYAAVGLLPGNHPYLNPANAGRFGLRHVIAQAGGNLVFDRRHIDQVVVFFALLAGFVLLVLQFIIMFFMMFLKPALATMPATPTGFFITPDPANDIALRLLDMVFGIPDFFGSCISTAAACLDWQGNPVASTTPAAYPWPIHTALHSLYEFYSFGLMFVAAIVIIYYAMSIAGETAASGTPFGKRFNGLWAPVRLIFFMFLLIPFVSGINIAQYITLYVAKLGSGFATNGWLVFNDYITTAGAETYLGNEDTLIATPQSPSAGALLQFFTVASTCKYAYRITYNKFIQGYVVRNGNGDNARMLWQWPAGDTVVGPVPPGGPNITAAEALELSMNGDITIRFGEYNPQLYPGEKGNVFPFCGEINLKNPGLTSDGGVIPLDVHQDGMVSVFEGWFNTLIIGLWTNADIHTWGSDIAQTFLASTNNPGLALPGNDSKIDITSFFKDLVDNIVATGVADQVDDDRWQIPPYLLDMGWAGSAMWYNRIAEMNGGLIDAIYLTPNPSLWPSPMEDLLKEKRKQGQDISGEGRFDPRLSNGQAFQPSRPEEKPILNATTWAYDFWQSDDGIDAVTLPGAGPRQATQNSGISNNIIHDVLNTLLGTNGLLDMRNNDAIHPLAKLSALGKALVDKAITNLAYASGSAIGGGVIGILTGWTGTIANTAASMFLTFASIGLLAGVVLFYVVPFLPFVYMFFAVSTWIKAIFEAMVGVPLWALAHLRIDGNGLPGRNAMNGYFLLMEIFLRPLITLFGLVASLIIFSSMIYALNQIFDLVIVNVGGYNVQDKAADPLSIAFYRSIIDEFFYTIIYTIIVYMMGMSCFKLIDNLPTDFMRWISSVESFKDNADAGQQLSGFITKGSTGVMAQAGQLGGIAQSGLTSLIARGGGR